MGANHSYGSTRPSSPGTVRATLAVIVPLAMATIIALIWMWPNVPKATGQPAPGMTKVTGTIFSVKLKPCPKQGGGGVVPEDRTAGGDAAPGEALPPPDPKKCGDANVELTSGPKDGQIVTAGLPDAPGSQKFAAGDDVVLLYTPDLAEGSPYQLSDHQRSNALWMVAAAFMLAVIAFGRWRGITALIGLAITFLLLLTFLIPAIVAGQSPLLAAIVCAAAIMLAVLYLTHGFTIPTSVAVIGTLLSLALTGLLAVGAIGLTHLNGITDDSSLFLGLNYQINTQGLLLASVIIGALGVLDDVTVTQAMTVSELARANPSYGFRQLYRAAARVGRAHIASVINTIILAYSGAALPLLLLFSIGRQPLGEVLSSPIIAQEIVRAAVGTIGLIAAVPLTTALAALASTRQTSGEVDSAPQLKRHRSANGQLR